VFMFVVTNSKSVQTVACWELRGLHGPLMVHSFISVGFINEASYENTYQQPGCNDPPGSREVHRVSALMKPLGSTGTRALSSARSEGQATNSWSNTRHDIRAMTRHDGCFGASRVFQLNGSSHDLFSPNRVGSICGVSKCFIFLQSTLSFDREE